MKKNAIVLLVGICLSGCGGMKLNPFSGKAKTNTDYQTYICNDNKQFKLKMMDGNQHAWLLMADHEVYLSRRDEASLDYVNEHYQLRFEEEMATLSNAGELQYAGCHIAE